MSLITNLDDWVGSLDFSVLEDHRIEMEIFEYEDDFGAVDVDATSNAIRIAMTDKRDLPLREKLKDLQIEWLK